MRTRPSFVSDWNIRRKLLAATCLLTLVPTLALTVFSYAIASNSLEHKVREYSHDILFQTTTTMEDRLQKIDEISFSVAIDPDVQANLASADDPAVSDLEKTRVEASVKSVLSSQVLFHDDVNAIFLTSNGGRTFELDKTRRGPGLAMDASARSRLEVANGGPVWFGGTQESGVVTLGRQVNSTTTQKPLGSLLLDVPEDFLFQVISDTQSVFGGTILVVDSSGRIISAAEKATLSQRSPIPTDQVTSDAYTFDTVAIDGQRQYMAVSEPLRNSWRIVAVVPVDVYQAEVTDMRTTLMVGGAAIVVLAFILAVGIAANLARPIQQLSRDMTRFGRGDLGMRSGVHRSDEIGQLSESFNSMADSIGDLVTTVYEEQTLKREIEVRSLRMQINPHFLYNTLETINWMARTEGADDAGVMAKSLGDLLRATIDAQDMVPLSDEIEKLRLYLQIQGYRYGTRLTVDFDLEPATLTVPVPTLILQPLVENAIVHGIEPTLRPGTLAIRTRMTCTTRIGDERLEIQILDDGMGMTPDQIGRYGPTGPTDCSAACTPSRDSVGLHNVIRRIRAIFANDGSLSISSEPGEGTTVTLRFPTTSMRTDNRNREET
jgi:two-component system sensor histidine kinase YesM